MTNYIQLDEVVLLGRMFDEYRLIFGLDHEYLRGKKILDVASGVSSFCAEANGHGYDVIASDRIYGLPATEIEKKCRQDLAEVLIKLSKTDDHYYIWDYFENLSALKKQRTKAYRLFLEDYQKKGASRYIPTEYPKSDFKDGQFDIALLSSLLFIYDEILDYRFHKQLIIELIRITKNEIRIWPLVNLRGTRSRFVEKLTDDDLKGLNIDVRKVNYRFLRNSDEMMVVSRQPIV